MINDVKGSIVLSGADAGNFAHALFNPTLEDIKENRQHVDYINNNISITPLDNGFRAEITNLDLSFLDEVIEERVLTLKDTFRIDVREECYSFGNENRESSIRIREDDRYRDSKNNTLLVLAA